MGLYLDSRMPWAEYSGIAAETYFVDKSALLKELITAFGKKNRYFCITRPRRFGKSVMAHMVAAFFGQAVDCATMFERLEIAHIPQ